MMVLSDDGACWCFLLLLVLVLVLVSISNSPVSRSPPPPCTARSGGSGWTSTSCPSMSRPSQRQVSLHLSYILEIIRTNCFTPKRWWLFCFISLFPSQITGLQGDLSIWMIYRVIYTAIRCGFFSLCTVMHVLCWWLLGHNKTPLFTTLASPE